MAMRMTLMAMAGLLRPSSAKLFTSPGGGSLAGMVHRSVPGGNRSAMVVGSGGGTHAGSMLTVQFTWRSKESDVPREMTE